MNPQQNQLDLKKTDSKDSKDIKINPKTDTPKSAKSKASASPKENKKNIPMPNERDYNKDFSLSFGELYEYHINIIEQKTNLKINQIYIFLLISFFFFMIGHFELIFSYIITGYYPIIWTREDYKEKKDNFWKKWGTYWTIFSLLIFFDLHKNDVLKVIPLYFIIKCIFLLMLYLPGFTIAETIFDGFLKDYLRQIEKYLQNKDDNDTMINDLKKNMKVKTH